VISPLAANVSAQVDSPPANALTDANCRSTANHEADEGLTVAFRNKGNDSDF
jgi:hypothetical protein